MLLSFISPYFDAMDTGSGGGAAPGGAGGAGGTGGSSTVYDLTADSMVRIPGEKEPVKWGDYSSRYVPKSEYTKTTQSYSQQIQQRDQQLQQLQQRIQQAQSAQAQPQANPIGQTLQALMDKPYVTGREAATLVAQVLQNGIQPLQSALQQRDQLLTLLWQRLQAVDGIATNLNTQTRDQQFKQKLAGWKKDLELPDDPDVDEFLQDVYLSHEGNDLDQEFPAMVKARWGALQRIINAANNKKVDEARAARFNPALKRGGGNATPGKPLRSSGFKDAKQIADELWDSLGGTQT